MNLEDYGYGDWHRDTLKSREADESHLARITAVDRDRYMIGSPLGAMPAEATGRLIYAAETTEDVPCVGDWVLVDYLDNNEHAVIRDLLPRKTVLRRRASGDRAEYQPIAANIDVAFIVQSVDTDFNLNRLDRYVVMANDGGIASILLLTKCDLVDPAKVEQLTADVKRNHAMDVVPLSGATGAGYDGFVQTLERGRTYCLIGSSGVGKSTILNRLLGKEEFAIGSVRTGGGKGRHTTTRRQLVALENGALFIDTPGMRELGMMAFETGLDESFQDIAGAAGECRYADCTHTVESGCAIRAMVDAGQLSEGRYRSYLKLAQESKHYEMTLLEKRKKDKAFGRMLRNYEKFKEKN
jgi:ribosome biogenesis GTPase / thiamine phosphate phosphatase